MQTEKQITPYQETIYQNLGKLIKQEKKDSAEEQKGLLTTLSKYKTFDRLLATSKFYHKPIFYTTLTFIASIAFFIFFDDLPSENFNNFKIIAIFHTLLCIIAYIAYQLNRKERALLNFCKECNIYQNPTHEPSISDEIIFVAVKQWIKQKFGIKSTCYSFLKQTATLFELKLYCKMWKKKHNHFPSPKSRLLTQAFYPYLENEKGIKFNDFNFDTMPLEKEFMNHHDAVEIRTFDQLKKFIDHDLKAGKITKKFASLITTQLVALESLDELKGIIWVWNQHFKQEKTIAKLESITSKCDLFWYLKKKIKLSTAQMRLTKYESCKV